MLGLDGIVKGNAKQAAIKVLTNNPIGRFAINHVGETYLAGHSINEGIETVRKYHSMGLMSSVDVLGEASSTTREADTYSAHNLAILSTLKSSFPGYIPSTLSFKASGICVANEQNGVMVFSPETPLSARVTDLSEDAYEKGINLTIDMEDHRFTNATLIAARYAWAQGYTNLGIVLQTSLERTKEDLREAINATHGELRVRLVRGIYNEPESIATKDKEEAKNRIVLRACELVLAGGYAEIATHDERVIYDFIEKVAIPHNIPSHKYEFQFLKGVPVANKLARELLNTGHIVRFYMPIETQAGSAAKYIGRRLEENPGILAYGIKNLRDTVLGRS